MSKSSECILETSGYSVRFEFRSSEDRSWLDVTVEFRPHPQLNIDPIRPQHGSMQPHELRLLIRYFRQHIESIRSGHNVDAKRYISLETVFWLQATKGWSNPETSTHEGSFSLIFMVQVGRVGKSGNIYLGGDSKATFDAIEHFNQSLEHILQELAGPV